MIIPSIDLMGGQAVQLIGGKQHALDAGDPRPLAERFALAGDIAVVDLDAALGRGDNTALIRELLQLAPCRVGGGIRSVERAIEWLDAGAAHVVLGTAATPEVLRELPRDRVIAALDAVEGEVVVEGWQTRTGRDVRSRMEELRDYVAGFLVTFVEREGRMQGTDPQQAAELVSAAGTARLTVAGGVTTVDEIATLDRLGVDAQVGMALYTGRLELADAIAAPLTSDRTDDLWPTVVTDECGVALGLAWSSAASLRAAVQTRTGVYQSRTRGLWHKGATSGATQQLLRIALDCDRDALRFTVRQRGTGFCHLGTKSCWGAATGLGGLAATLMTRRTQAPPGSYTARLFNDAALLRSKLVEEAGELATAEQPAEVCAEAADVLYFTMVALARSGLSLADVERELDRRARTVTRRRGDAKPTPREL
ncbi:MAG: phosphoribosyl-ATP diphosphatase [Phycisphaerales bacterium]|nr:phosphoribosyl-ATP diphosphatase [Phycisphaerales bacterium]